MADSMDDADLLDVALVVGDTPCEVTASTIESYDYRKLTITLSEAGMAEFIKELQLQDHDSDAAAWLANTSVDGEEVLD